MHTTSLSPYPEVGRLFSDSPMSHVEICQSKEVYNFEHFPRRMPIKIILNDDEEVPALENHSATTEENSIYHFPNWSGTKSKYRLLKISF